ncbi:MAG: DNA glycosylase [Verrucomicrobiota bacterium]|jgi:N-glycosylase/DNA lyase
MRREKREVRNVGKDPTTAGIATSSSSSFPSAIVLRVRNYDLAATLDSGQVFRWQEQNGSWIGVVGKHWVRLRQMCDGIRAETAAPVKNWDWLLEFLQIEVDWAAVLETFPDDAPMRAAVAACRGLRVLRQDPWECLASFILSSTKQIVQIRQIIALLCERFGEPITPGAPASCRRVPAQATNAAGRDAGAPGNARHLFHAFPSPENLSRLTEAELRACKMGFRAPHLLAAARQIAEGKFDLNRPRHLPLPEARAELMKLRGVGGKIADCVLLFAYGFDGAFPVDVWVERALHRLYFPRRRVTAKRLRHFAATHFGPHAGHAQQYLFHYMRTKLG